MKFVTVENETIDDFIDRFVDTKDPKFKRAESFAALRKTIWEVMAQPMVLKEGSNVSQLTVLAKCQDVIHEVVRTDVEIAAFEDADFDAMYSAFREYNGWKTEFARVILIASEALKHANDGNTLGGKSGDREKGTANSRSKRRAKA